MYFRQIDRPLHDALKTNYSSLLIEELLMFRIISMGHFVRMMLQIHFRAESAGQCALLNTIPNYRTLGFGGLVILSADLLLIDEHDKWQPV